MKFFLRTDLNEYVKLGKADVDNVDLATAFTAEEAVKFMSDNRYLEFEAVSLAQANKDKVRNEFRNRVFELFDEMDLEDIAEVESEAKRICLEEVSEATDAYFSSVLE